MRVSNNFVKAASKHLLKNRFELRHIATAAHGNPRILEEFGEAIGCLCC
jgi:hypothetical protein